MIYRINSGVEVEKTGLKEDDDFVVYDSNNESVFVVNSIGGDILLKLMNGSSMEELLSKLRAEYLLSEDAYNDVASFIDDMYKKGIILIDES